MNKLKEYRNQAKLNQSQLAEIVGCSQGYISHFETGRADPDSKTIRKIIAAFSKKKVACSFEDLFPSTEAA